MRLHLRCCIPRGRLLSVVVCCGIVLSLLIGSNAAPKSNFAISRHCFVLPTNRLRQQSTTHAVQNIRVYSSTAPSLTHSFVRLSATFPTETLWDNSPSVRPCSYFLSRKSLVGSGPTATRLFLATNNTPNVRSYSQTGPVNMPRGVKKENLPSKICVTCGRPFTWRKKWEKVWDEVTTCSKSCNRKRRLAKREDHQGRAMEGDDCDDEDLQQQQQQKQLLVTSPTTGQPTVTDEDDDSSGTRSTSSHDHQWPTRNDDEHCQQADDDLEIALVEFGLDNDSPNSDDETNHPPSTESGDTIAYDLRLQAEETLDPAAQRKAERKAAKKLKKAERRAQREGRGDPSAGQKQCDMCSKSVDLLIRCLYEEGQTDWKMVCGRCWKLASGGVVDGDENHPHYRYGGLWKNRRAQR